MCIYLQGSGDGFHLDSFYLPTRSIFWIEAAYYLLPNLKSENVSTAALAAISGGAILAEFFVGEYVFVLNTVIAICANDMCQDCIRRQECELCLFAQDEHHNLLYPFVNHQYSVRWVK